MSTGKLDKLKGAIICIVLVAGLNFVGAAWSNPTLAPTSGNPDIPINVSNNSQTKLGDLTLFNVYAGGNVGIGTAAPSQKLDVVGQIKASGDICTDAGGGICLSAAGGGTAILNGYTELPIYEFYKIGPDIVGFVGDTCDGNNTNSSPYQCPAGVTKNCVDQGMCESVSCYAYVTCITGYILVKPL